MEMSERYHIAPWQWAEQPDIWMQWAEMHQEIKANAIELRNKKP